jgi:ribonuclease-3
MISRPIELALPLALPMRDSIAKLFGIDQDSPRLVEALTHPSYRNERAASRDNQRLEFLGDAILGLCVADLLFQRFPTADEGRLTRMRAGLVNAETLAQWARERRLSQVLLLGRGAAASGVDDATNVLADTVEALIAATYLDAGLQEARRVCAEIVGGDLATLEAADGRDPKSQLQERVQSAGGEPPTYEVEQAGGPAHDPWFTVSVRVGGTVVARGSGRSKRAAERAAATAALEHPGGPDGEPSPHLSTDGGDP